MNPTVLSVFSGAGGFDLGLQCAGFHTVACIEIADVARRSLCTNLRNCCRVDTGDVCVANNQLTPRHLGLRPRQLSVLAAGPPCQPYSKAMQWSSPRQGVRDPRSKCLQSLIQLVDQFLPRVLLIENVPGFFAGRSSAVGFLERSLRYVNRRNGSRYLLQWRLLNAADFGVPQNRERGIMIASREDDDFHWPHPSHVGAPIRAWDAIGGVRQTDVAPATGSWAAARAANRPAPRLRLRRGLARADRVVPP